MLIIPRSWERLHRNQDIYEWLLTIDGKVYRDKDGRKTLQFIYKGRSYFAKVYRGLGYIRLLRYLFQFRLPVLSARNEWQAIRRLHALRINTLQLVGYGQRGFNPARRQSFLITEALENTLSLENFCRPWPQHPPKPALKRHLITEVARMARSLHESGMCHRDFYICHFLLETLGVKPEEKFKRFQLYLIDLHRVRTFSRLPIRWRIKDVAALYFSSMDIGLSQRDLLRFIRHYLGMPLGRGLSANRHFWPAVDQRARSLYRKIHHREPPADSTVSR